MISWKKRKELRRGIKKICFHIIIPCSYKVVEEADIEVVHPDIVLERLLQVYENTILTGKIRIYGIELIFSEFDMQKVISPCWRFLVQMEENGIMVDGEILYDAVTGKQIG